ncbi:Dipeptidyl peptidase 8 [Vitis vinifera]|uniref:Dipeptidyl peptidase 8 n=1 Tax=Vitis vinifera TaxID=29760 RepID=A0A438HWX7_VITVI|nr:Dipeptidyl peptidase 8 [Vitis vinifera]
MVEQIAGVNEAAGLVYFTGTLDGPLESNLYSAKLFLDGNEPLQAPLRVLLCSLSDGKLGYAPVRATIHRSQIQTASLEPPEIVQIQANDGTTLFGALYKPDETRFGPPPYKTLISVYGGPSVQLVCDSWMNTVDMRAQYLRSRGILVWKLDNRGTARRGLKFESCLKYNAGRIDAEDQLTGAEWLIKKGLAKVGHIGLYGWSYGGYLSAMTLARFPDIFRCAVSGAPRHIVGWLRHILHREVHGLAFREPCRLRAHCKVGECPCLGRKALRTLDFPGRTPHASQVSGPHLHGREDLDFIERNL